MILDNFHIVLLVFFRRKNFRLWEKINKVFFKRKNFHFGRRKTKVFWKKELDIFERRLVLKYWRYFKCEGLKARQKRLIQTLKGVQDHWSQVSLGELAAWLTVSTQIHCSNCKIVILFFIRQLVFVLFDQY